MCIRDRSNSVLFELLMRKKEGRSDCYFGMGCNFLGLNDLEKAQESFEKYLALDPEGEFQEEVEEFLMLFADFEEEEEYPIGDAAEQLQQQLAQEGKSYLDNCEYQKAAEVLEKVETDNPDLLFAKNNLALSYYCCLLYTSFAKTEITPSPPSESRGTIWSSLPL